MVDRGDDMRGIMRKITPLVEGKTVSLYHGTIHKLENFAPLSHFGTLKCALERLSSRGIAKTGVGYIYKVNLRMSNPLTIPDSDAILAHTPGGIADLCKKKRILTDDEVDIVHRAEIFRSSDPAAELATLVTSKGYDGFKYKNRFEDPGKMSYCILRADQASIDGDPLQLSQKEIMNRLSNL